MNFSGIYFLLIQLALCSIFCSPCLLQFIVPKQKQKISIYPFNDLRHRVSLSAAPGQQPTVDSCCVIQLQLATYCITWMCHQLLVLRCNGKQATDCHAGTALRIFCISPMSAQCEIDFSFVGRAMTDMRYVSKRTKSNGTDRNNFMWLNTSTLINRPRWMSKKFKNFLCKA